MSKTFPQESSKAFFNLKSLHYAEQKKHFGILVPPLNKPMRFITKLLEEQFKDSP